MYEKLPIIYLELSIHQHIYLFIYLYIFILYIHLGSRLHHLRAEEGHAQRLREGGKEEGSHQKPGCSLLIPSAGRWEGRGWAWT